LSKWLLAVCDSDESYIDKFVEFVQETKKGLFEIKAFTSTKGVIEYLKENIVDVLLISDKEVIEDISEIKIKSTIILSEGVQNQSTYDYPSINKFQSADNVIREVMECTRGLEKNPVSTIETLNKCCKVIGVYSPLNRCYKTSLAIVMGMFQAKTKKVLYINLEEFSGLSNFINIFENKDLSDLMYFYKQNPKKFMSKLYASTNNINGLEFINPIIFSKEIRNLEIREWVEFINFISSNSNYEIIIIDLSNMLEDVFEMLEICDSIFMPILTDYISVSKITEFESYLQLIGRERIFDKVKKLKLPEIREGDRGEKHFEILLKGEFGSYVGKHLS